MYAIRTPATIHLFIIICTVERSAHLYYYVNMPIFLIKLKMESSNRPKRQRIHDRESENEHLRDLSDLSGFSEFDNSDTDEDLDTCNHREMQQIENPSLSPNVTNLAWFNVIGNYQKQFVLNKNPGLKIDIPENGSVWYHFNLFCSDIIELIVTETNRNAEQFLSKIRLSKSIYWFTFMDGLSAFALRVIGVQNPDILIVLPVKRCLGTDDRIYEVRGLIERLVKNYQSVMEPDESMVSFRGRLKFRLYFRKGS
ncbi:Uncharacterized protein FWK35_00022851 [Aphis craccivora]|uniref:Uncharacterized protein n=1 Tax=Aphis craccivora TaxID=307492 RepID=A0A6G0W0W2_APHCR|nr:Uncharacterized protein FWK35_00022851 [Aphis craccivora]